MRIRMIFRKNKLTRSTLQEIFVRKLSSKWFLKFFWKPETRRNVVRTDDPVRYGAVELALSDIIKHAIPGSIAEGGVYQGMMSRFLHERTRNRPLYLFDTFEGFSSRDSDSVPDNRFKDTSVQDVLDYIGDTHNVNIRKGYFPETAAGLENEKFSFVMIDFDRYQPTLAALEFFYPRTSPGGFIFIHDYSSPESDWACLKAVDTFLSNKPEKPVAIPDTGGSVIFRKIG